jgi:hypothetical protein
MKKIEAVIVSHRFNGNVDGADKFVEVEGKKYVDDGSGKAKVGEDGKPILFVEKKADALDLSTADLEALAKVNPAVAKMLAEKAEADKLLSQNEAARQEKERKDAESRGEWQKIADQEKLKREDVEKQLSAKTELLTKYVGSVESILKEVIATIPKENLTLIPEKFSNREKLEYITQNAKLLGAKINAAKGDKVDKNDIDVNGDGEAKLVAEIQALMTLGGKRTQAQSSEMVKKSQELQELRKKRLEDEKKAK